MSGTKNFDRRQFVRKSVAAASLVATGTVASKVALACPISFDAEGASGDWFCIIDIDDSHPIFTIYTWKNCKTGATFETIGKGADPLGNCGNPKNDPSCAQGIEIGRWEEETIGEKVYKFLPDTDPEFRKTATRLLLNLTKRST